MLVEYSLISSSKSAASWQEKSFNQFVNHLSFYFLLFMSCMMIVNISNISLFLLFLLFNVSIVFCFLGYFTTGGTMIWYSSTSKVLTTLQSSNSLFSSWTDSTIIMKTPPGQGNKTQNNQYNTEHTIQITITNKKHKCNQKNRRIKICLLQCSNISFLCRESFSSLFESRSNCFSFSFFSVFSWFS